MWDVSVNGRRYQITTAWGPNNKLVIRANGKAIASPLNPDEEERVFLVEDRPYRLRRKANGFLLEPVVVEYEGSRHGEPLDGKTIGMMTIGALCAFVALLFTRRAMILPDSAIPAGAHVDGVVNALRFGMLLAALAGAWLAYEALLMHRQERGARALVIRAAWTLAGIVAFFFAIADRMTHTSGWLDLVDRAHHLGLVLLIATMVAAGAVLWLVEGE